MPLNHIRGLVEDWARWRRAKPGRELGYPQSTQLGRILDGMPSTDCPTCRGRGKAYGGDCPTCSGSGKIKADPDIGKVNPAFLKSTRPAGYQPDNPICEHIDRLVCELRRDSKTLSLYYVIKQEFCRLEHQRRRWMDHANIEQAHYEYLLDQALNFIKSGLDMQKKPAKITINAN